MLNQLLQIVHRDLKPENLLFSDKSDSPRLMIADFGLSKILKHHDDILMTACGTPGYVAPEVLKQLGYGRSVDIWSVGVILYTVLCGYTPFWGEDHNALFQCILKGVYDFDEDYWSDISDEAKDLINKMLEYDPDRRITAHDALQHPWFKRIAELNANDLNNLNVKLDPNHHKNGRSAALKRTILVIRGVTRMRNLKINNNKREQRRVSQPQFNGRIINNYDKGNKVNLVRIVSPINSVQGEIGMITENDNNISHDSLNNNYSKNDDSSKISNNNDVINPLHNQFQAFTSTELFDHIGSEYIKDNEKRDTSRILIGTNSVWSDSESDISSINSIPAINS